MLTIKSGGKVTRKFKIPKAKKVVPVVVVKPYRKKAKMGRRIQPESLTLDLIYNESLDLITGVNQNIMGAIHQYTSNRVSAPKNTQAVGNFVPQGMFDQVGKYFKYKVLACKFILKITEDISRSTVLVITPVNSEQQIAPNVYSMFNLQVASASMKPNSSEMSLGREGKVRTFSKTFYPNVIDSISKSAYKNDFGVYEGNVTTTLASIVGPTRLPSIQFAVANIVDNTQMTMEATLEIRYKVRFYRTKTPIVSQSL